MSPFFSLLNKLVGGLHLAYFQYVQHPNATPLTAQNIKIKLPFVQKKCLGRESTSSVVCPYNSIYFTWTETINCLRLYKHKIEHNTLGLSKVSVPPLPPSSPLSISSQVHPFVCRQSLFSKQGGEKNPRTRQVRATLNHPDCVRVGWWIWIYETPRKRSDLTR